MDLGAKIRASCERPESGRRRRAGLGPGRTEDGGAESQGRHRIEEQDEWEKAHWWEESI